MNTAQNEFLNGLKYEEGETSQKQIAEEAIKKQLFRILHDSKMKKGESKDLNETVEQISNDLGLQENKVQIAQYITQLLQSGNYQFDIDDNGNIRANYSRLYILQETAAEKNREEVYEILQEFIQRTELYASELEKQNARVTETNLKNKFSPREQDLKGNWITLAIDHVLENRNQDR